MGTEQRLTGALQIDKYDTDSITMNTPIRSGADRPLMNAMKTPGHIALFLLLLVFTRSVVAEVSATLSRGTIFDGETVYLVIQSSGKPQGGEPELSVLEPDFDILGTSTSQQVQIINGRRSERRQWRVELEPRQTGTLTIPPITVGKASTQALDLQVIEQAATEGTGADPEVFVRTAIEPAGSPVYVQQQLHFTVQLYFRVPLSEGNIESPAVANAIVEKLGEDIQFSTTVNAREYQVIERHYAIFPEQSGELVLPGVRFTGRLRSETGRRTSIPGMDAMMERFFSSGDRGRRIRVKSEPLTLEVKPRPPSYSGSDWLPSEQVQLHDSWTEAPPEFRVGEPVTRTITLEAKGLEASQLPVITVPQVAGMRLYPERPVHDTRTDGRWVYGSSRQSTAYVPGATGAVSIPGMRVDWWDTGTQTEKTVTLPPWKVTVLPGRAAESARPPVTAVPAEPDPGASGMSEGPVAADSTTPAGYWHWILVAVGVLVALIAILWLSRGRRTRVATAVAPAVQAEQAEVSVPPPATAASQAAWQQACGENDPHASAKALLQWAATTWPEDPPLSLGVLAKRLVAGADEVRELDQALYAAGSSAWQGDALWAVLQNGLQASGAAAAEQDEVLAPLYPTWERK